MHFKTPTELWNQWTQLCQKQFDSKNQFGISIGLELEFFLMKNGNPVNLTESQTFMAALCDKISLSKLNTSIEEEELEGKKCISKVKFPTTKTSWAYVCYEYPPHLMEISFSYHFNLTPLESEVAFLMETVTSTARSVGLEAEFAPILSKEQLKSVVAIDNELHRQLRTSRIQLLADGPYASETHLADFPSYLAAFHVHVGGYEWWKDEKLIENIYRLEPYVMLEAKGISYKERWDHYLKVFHSFPLVGFPATPSWSLAWWITQLFVTSYQRQKEKLKNIFGLNKLRDLQLIRPRAIGTIEFRGDAAQGTTDDMMRLAALRLGQYLLAMRGLPPTVLPYASARELWLEQMEAGRYLDETARDEILKLIEIELRRRGLGEEKYLHPHKKKNVGRTA